MFGLFRKKVTQAEFGQIVLHAARDSLITDGILALACAFDDFDASGGGDRFLAAHGIPLDTQKLFFRYFAQGSLHMAILTLDQGVRPNVVRGAIELFNQGAQRYDLNKSFMAVEGSLFGTFRAAPELEPLKAPGLRRTVVDYAKFILESWPCPTPELRARYIERFPEFAAPLERGVDVVHRACVFFEPQVRSDFELRF